MNFMSIPISYPPVFIPPIDAPVPPIIKPEWPPGTFGD